MIVRFILKLFQKVRSIFSLIYTSMEKQLLLHCGKNVGIGQNSKLYPLERIKIGDNSYIGPGANIITTRANVFIGNNVMFGPSVTIITGNHRTDIVGRTMRSITDEEKRDCDDEDVIIEDDVWVGANATILKGVTVGTGSIIAAGSVVTRSTPPILFPAVSLQRSSQCASPLNRFSSMNHSCMVLNTVCSKEIHTIRAKQCYGFIKFFRVSVTSS